MEDGDRMNFVPTCVPLFITTTVSPNLGLNPAPDINWVAVVNRKMRSGVRPNGWKYFLIVKIMKVGFEH